MVETREKEFIVIEVPIVVGWCYAWDLLANNAVQSTIPEEAVGCGASTCSRGLAEAVACSVGEEEPDPEAELFLQNLAVLSQGVVACKSKVAELLDDLPELPRSEPFAGRFGLGWTPCLGPTLTGVIAVASATEDETAEPSNHAACSTSSWLGKQLHMMLFDDLR